MAGDLNDLVDAAGSEGDNRTDKPHNDIYAGFGDDALILGTSDRLLGRVKNDRFFATSGGDNVIIGGVDADQFWIASAEIPESANMVTDFIGGEDVIGIAGLGIGFDDLNVTQQGDDALIGANGSDLAILEGTDLATLTADDFVFA